MENIRLKSITCHQPSETDKDEIYLRFRTEKIWPSGAKFLKIDTNETLDINLGLDISSIWVEIELWEYDYLKKDDHLGDFIFKSSNYSGEYTCELKVTDEWEGKTKYTLKYEILKSILG